ncbi:MAG: hypothetical protein OEW08_05695, partial [Gammaproteobacteria bacterium]|nr:hypothetical protein [Gammaproteobacteria bacterium]
LGESQKWAVRGSMKKNIYTSSTTKNTTVVPAVASTTTESSGTNAISFGIGAGYVATKGLTIDAAMNQSVLFAGTNWLSTGAGTLIGRLSITYEM